MTELTLNTRIYLDRAIEKCSKLKDHKDELDTQYKVAKKELEEFCKDKAVTSFTSDNGVEMKITESRRFKAYSDDETVLRLIPIQHLKECTSLNKKKIDGLIKKGVLPNSIKDEEKFTRITTTKFTKVE